MANNRFDQNNGQDNWDDAPKKDGAPGSGGSYYRQYSPPTGNGQGNFGFPGGQPPRDSDGATSKTLGIVGLFITFCFCQIAGIVMGIIGYNKAKRSAQFLGYETTDAATGRVLGIVNIVLGILLLVGSVASLVFTGVLTSLIAGEGVEAWNFGTMA